MTKNDRQMEQLKHISGGGQTPGTNWGRTPGEATNRTGKKVTTPHTQHGNAVPDLDGEDRTRIEEND